VSTELVSESQTLAQLHHPHIVPIYSVHQAGPFQAVCMPYFGATTLADVLSDLTQGESVPVSGKALVSTVNARRNATHGGQAWPWRPPRWQPRHGLGRLPTRSRRWKG